MKIYKSLDELPFMLNVKQLSRVLCISQSGAYQLTHSVGFPVLKVGKRLLIPKDGLVAWIETQSKGGIN